MVYVPILKIDLPEPSVQELLPGAVHVLINTCTRVFDAVHDYLSPLTPEQEVILYAATIEHMPEEFRKARKRIAERNIQDDDKMSEELEDASYAYYRRRMREHVAGFSDEATEDLTFRRLMSPYNAGRDLFDEQPPQLEPEHRAGPTVQQAAADIVLPGRVRQATVTAVAGSAGLALGAGVVKLAYFLSKQLRHRRKPKKRAGQQAATAGRRPQQGASKGSRITPKTTPRTTPRQR